MLPSEFFQLLKIVQCFELNLGGYILIFPTGSDFAQIYFVIQIDIISSLKKYILQFN